MSQSAPKRNVSYIKPNEPSFLKAFKAKAGYKDNAVTIETKRADLQQKEEEEKGKDAPFREDELPVMIMGGDVSEEEYRKFVQETKKEGISQKDIPTEVTLIKEHQKTSANEDTSGKIIFKKPNKRTSSEAKEGGASSKLYATSKRVHREEKKKTKSDTKISAIKNSSLLSFDDDDENDD